MKREQLEEMWNKLTDVQKEVLYEFIDQGILIEEDATNKCDPFIRPIDRSLPSVVPGLVFETSDSTDICSVHCKMCNEWYDDDEFETNNDTFVIEHVLTNHFDEIINGEWDGLKR